MGAHKPSTTNLVSRISRRPAIAFSSFAFILLVLFGVWRFVGGLGTEAPADWAGTYDTQWVDGGAILHLEQDGSRVTGAYPLYGGRIEAQIIGRDLEGSWEQPGEKGTFTFRLSQDGQSFIGRFGNGHWWTGRRLDDNRLSVVQADLDLSTPRRALRSFLTEAEGAMMGDEERFATANKTIHPESLAEFERPAGQLHYTRRLYLLIDNFYVPVRALPGEADGPQNLDLTHRAMDTPLILSIVPFTGPSGDKGWRLSPPPLDEIEARLAAIYESRGQSERDPDKYLELATPRDTMRTFLVQYGKWNEGGREHVFRTMRLDDVPPSLREERATLYAQYLKEILDRTSFIVFQEIPNIPDSNVPYTVFSHPDGEIVIAPFDDSDGKRIWQFTPQSLRALRPLFLAMEDLDTIENVQANSLEASYFSLRTQIRAIDRRLLSEWLGLEIWQWLGLVIFSILAVLTGWIVALALAAVVEFARRKSSYVREPFRMKIVAWVFFGVLSSIWLFQFLGLPDFLLGRLQTLQSVIVVATGFVISLRLINRFGHIMRRRNESTREYRQEILRSLLTGLAKVAAIVVALIILADLMRWPYYNVLAGLGIGGLAIALAAQGILANVFAGFAIYLDRTVQVGDFCSFNDKLGTVEQIGLRSTKLRGVDRTIITVPNAVFVDMELINFSKRDSILFEDTLCLRSETLAGQVREVLSELRKLMIEHPMVDDEPARARFSGFGEHGLNIEIFAYIKTTSFEEYAAIVEELNFKIAELIESCGSGFAIPATVNYLSQDVGLQASTSSSD